LFLKLSAIAQKCLLTRYSFMQEGNSELHISSGGTYMKIFHFGIHCINSIKSKKTVCWYYKL